MDVPEPIPCVVEAALGSQTLLANGRGKQDLYQKGIRIGKGAFGDVFVVHQRGTPLDRKRAFVLKVIKLARQTEWQRQATHREIKLMAALRHPFIVPFIDQWLDNSHTVNVVLGYCEQGDLGVLLNKKQGKLFEEATLKSWLAQLLLALYYLEQQAVLHRDIKTGNIFLHAEGYVQLGDFGLASVRDSQDAGSQHDQSLVGTPHFMSPELLSQKGYSHQTDIWSLGCVMYELSAQKPAFTAFNLNGLVEKIRNRGTAPLPASYSQEWNLLIKSMLRKNPEKRPGVVELMSTPCMVSAVAEARRLARVLQPDIDLPPLSLAVQHSLSPQTSLDTAMTPLTTLALHALSSCTSADAAAANLLLTGTLTGSPTKPSDGAASVPGNEAAAVLPAVAEIMISAPAVNHVAAHEAETTDANRAGECATHVSANHHGCMQKQQDKALHDATGAAEDDHASVVESTSIRVSINGGQPVHQGSNTSMNGADRMLQGEHHLRESVRQVADVMATKRRGHVERSGMAAQAKMVTSKELPVVGKADAAAGVQLRQRLLKPGVLHARTGTDANDSPAPGVRISAAENAAGQGGAGTATQPPFSGSRTTPRSSARVQHSNPARKDAANNHTAAAGATGKSGPGVAPGNYAAREADAAPASRQIARRPWTAGTAAATTADGSSSSRCKTGRAASAAANAAASNNGNGSGSARAARVYAQTAFVFRATQPRLQCVQPTEETISALAKNAPTAVQPKPAQSHELLDQAQQQPHNSNADAVAVVEGITAQSKAKPANHSNFALQVAMQAQKQPVEQQAGAVMEQEGPLKANAASSQPVEPSSPAPVRSARSASAVQSSATATCRAGADPARKHWVAGARSGISKTPAVSAAQPARPPRVAPRYDPNDADVEDAGVRTSHAGAIYAPSAQLRSRRRTSASAEGLPADAGARTPATHETDAMDAKAAAELACITKAPSATAPSSSGCSTRRVSSENGLPPWRPAGAAVLPTAAKPGSPTKQPKPDSPRLGAKHVSEGGAAADSVQEVVGVDMAAGHVEAGSECEVAPSATQGASITSLRHARQALASRTSSSKTRQAALIANLTKAMSATKNASAITGAASTAAADLATPQASEEPTVNTGIAPPVDVDANKKPLPAVQGAPEQGRLPRQRRTSGLPQYTAPAPGSPKASEKKQTERSSEDGGRRSSLSGPLSSPLTSYIPASADNAIGDLSPIAPGASEYHANPASPMSSYPAVRMFDNAAVLADNPAADLSPMHTDGGSGESRLILTAPADVTSTVLQPAGLGMYYNAMFGMGRRTTDSSNTATGEAGQGSQRQSQAGASGMPAKQTCSSKQGGQAGGTTAASGGAAKRLGRTTGSSGGGNGTAPAPPSLLPGPPKALSHNGAEVQAGSRASSVSHIPLVTCTSTSSMSAGGLQSEPSSELDLAVEHGSLIGQQLQRQAQVTPRLYGSAPTQHTAAAAALMGVPVPDDDKRCSNMEQLVPSKELHGRPMEPTTRVHGSAAGAPVTSGKATHGSQQHKPGTSHQADIHATSPQLATPAMEIVKSMAQADEMHQLRQVVVDAHNLFLAGRLAELGKLLSAACMHCSNSSQK